MKVLSSSLLVSLFFSSPSFSLPFEKKSITYDEARKEFVIVVDRQFIVSVEGSSLAETKSSSVNVGDYPQKFKEVFKSDEK